MLGLTSCGFVPLYQAGQEEYHSELQKIKIKTIPDRLGQSLRNELLPLLTPYGQPKKPEYVLEIELETNKRDLGILRDATASYAEVILTAKYTLKEFMTGAGLTSGKSSFISSYNILSSAEFSTFISEKDAYERALKLVAQDISMRLAVYFQSNP